MPCQACFSSNLIFREECPSQRNLPKWIRKQKERPKKVEDAWKCLPSHATRPVPTVIQVGTKHVALFFQDIETAVRMEASFWLERQFCVQSDSGVRHWYQHSLAEMLDQVADSCIPNQDDYDIMHC